MIYFRNKCINCKGYGVIFEFKDYKIERLKCLECRYIKKTDIQDTKLNNYINMVSFESNINKMDEKLNTVLIFLKSMI